jgi:hypothetical protein
VDKSRNIKENLKGLKQFQMIIYRKAVVSFLSGNFNKSSVLLPYCCWFTLLLLYNVRRLIFFTISPVISPLFILSASINLIGGTFRIEKSEFIVIEGDKRAGTLDNSVVKSVGQMGPLARESLGLGRRQLAPC